MKSISYILSPFLNSHSPYLYVYGVAQYQMGESIWWRHVRCRIDEIVSFQKDSMARRDIYDFYTLTKRAFTQDGVRWFNPICVLRNDFRCHYHESDLPNPSALKRIQQLIDQKSYGAWTEGNEDSKLSEEFSAWWKICSEYGIIEQSTVNDIPKLESSLLLRCDYLGDEARYREYERRSQFALLARDEWVKERENKFEEYRGKRLRIRIHNMKPSSFFKMQQAAASLSVK